MSSQPESESPASGAAKADLVRQAEIIISGVLLGGVLLSAFVIMIGVVMFYVHPVPAGHGQFPSNVAQVASGLAHGNPLAVVVLGLLILLATPIMRVAVSILAFFAERDMQYVVITCIVLVILLSSFFFLGPALSYFTAHGG